MSPDPRPDSKRVPLDAQRADGRAYTFSPHFSARCDELFNPVTLPARESSEIDALQSNRLSALLAEQYGESAPRVIHLGRTNHFRAANEPRALANRPFIAGFSPTDEHDPGQLCLGFYTPERDGFRIPMTPVNGPLSNQLVTLLQLSRFLETAQGCHEGLVGLFNDYQLTGRAYPELESSIAPRSLLSLTRSPIPSLEACLTQCRALGIALSTDDIFLGIARGIAPLSCLAHVDPQKRMTDVMQDRQLHRDVRALVHDSQLRHIVPLWRRYSDSDLAGRHPCLDAHAELIRRGVRDIRMVTIGEGSGMQRAEDFLSALAEASAPIITHARTTEAANQIWEGARKLPSFIGEFRRSLETLSGMPEAKLYEIRSIVEATSALQSLDSGALYILRLLNNLAQLSAIEVDSSGPDKQLECAIGAAAGLLTCVRREVDRSFPGLFPNP